MTRNLIFILLVAASAILSLNHSTLGADGEPKSSIRLQKWQFHKDRTGKGHLILRLGNYGDRTVNVSEISLDKDHWTLVGKTIDAGKTVTWSYPVDDSPAYVEISTSEGKFRLDLDPENEAR